MFTADLAHRCQTVDVNCDAAAAARLCAAGPEPYLILVDSDGEPCGLVQAQEGLRRLLPASLVVHADLISLSGPFAQAQLARALRGRTVGDLLLETVPPLTVAHDTKVSQILYRLMSSDTPAAAVVDRTGTRPRVLGVVTAQRLLRLLLEERGHRHDELRASV